jgi:hypothetical protein
MGWWSWKNKATGEALLLSTSRPTAQTLLIWQVWCRVMLSISGIADVQISVKNPALVSSGTVGMFQSCVLSIVH